MLEKLLITLLPMIFLGGFIRRNLGVKQRTGQRIRAGDPLVNASIVVTAASIGVIILSVYSVAFYRLTGPIVSLRHPVLSALGLALLGLGIVLGWVVSGQLKSAWRVGVHADQRTELIQSGIYAHVRNPYFGTYALLFLGLLLVRPSVFTGILVGVAGVIFHRMVRKEEAHLQKLHGEAYTRYKARTGRYLPRW